MKILQASRSIEDSGGISKVAFRLALEWQKLGLEITTITSEIEPACAGQLAKVEIPFLHEQKKKSLLTYLTNYFWTKKFTKIVHRKFTKAANEVVTIAHRDAFGADICVGHSCHHQAVFEKKGAGKKWWWLNPMHHFYLKQERKMFAPGNFHFLVAISQVVKEEYMGHLGVPENKIRLIPNGVDVTQFSPEKKIETAEKVRKDFSLPSGPIFLFAGNEFERKGLKPLIQALGIYKNQEKNFSLLIMGKDNPEAYRDLGINLGLEENLRFLGFQREASVYFNAADAFFLPANYEPFGLVGLEAMAAGALLFACPVSGIRDYLQDGVNGVAISRDPENIADKLKAVMSSPSTIKSLIQEGRSTALQYSWEKIAKQYFELILEVEKIKVLEK